jgi:hypothetical protein
MSWRQCGGRAIFSCVARWKPQCLASMGVISFPILDSQIQDIIKHAERAPYGRGGETILDTSVRNTWQLTPVNVRIGGKSWGRSFQQILSTVANGLGGAGTDISAELYKLLVYEEGGFFLPHRDTEKTNGMFGTLTIVLPSVHCGGELVIRHAGREVTVDMSNAETSELTFAAFYADCEHAIKPITQGSRVCLTYNLLQRHVDLLFARWSRRALPQACRLVARRAIYCSRTIRIRHCWAAHR